MRLLLPALATVVWASPEALKSSIKANNGAASDFMASIPISTLSGPPSGRPTDLASARAAVLAGNYTSRLHHQGRDGCPSGCSSVGADTSAWPVYGTLRNLGRACNKTMLLDFALFNPVEDDESHVAISACTADLGHGDVSTSDAAAAACAPDVALRLETTSSLQLGTSDASYSSSAHVADAAATLDQLRQFSALPGAGCNETIKYAYSDHVAAGIYAGSGLASQGVLGSVLEKLSAQIKSDGTVAESMLVQMCANSSSRYSLGVLINTKGDLGAVQHGLQLWKNGSCVDMDNTVPDWQRVTYFAPSLLGSNMSSTTTATNSSSNPANVKLATGNQQHSSGFVASGSDACSTIQVESGDSCASLAAECGITPAEFTKYNADSSLCSSLKPGQHVCCSAGTLPDFSPKPDADGYCYSYLVKTGDSCSSIAAAHDLTNEALEQYNTQTWGWNGCQKLFADYNICLSSGYPPMPATVPNAVCGPQVNDTVKAPPGTDLSTLNQCPLNACCNIWGQCGTTAEFCTPSDSPTGAPGTAAPGENGCISNCGTDIVASSGPSEQYNIAYFEAYSWQRPCLHMSVTSIDISTYTHIHFSFITLNADFSINTDDVADQLKLFKDMVGIKKIVSIGGWAFSTDPSTYAIFRNAVATQANRDTLITNILNFLNDYDLDGIDWDWEYPNEPDIPGIPAGTEDDTTGFFLLLDQLKQQLPAGKTSSLTAPASFWYLQYFPIQALSLVVDYMVYMTYDLHGQWDYANKYSDPGCVSYDQGLGNCLRSHVNLTETINALSMITKAGVPSNMIAVGVSSYGRSFQMSTPGCWTEQCTYTGPESGAYPGPCTNTAGYISDYEIGLILDRNPSAQTYFDQNSYSNVVVFNDTQWVAYMDSDNKVTRKTLYSGLGFLGTADWAVDLQSEDGRGGANGGSDTGDSSHETIYIDPGIWNSATPMVTAPPGATLIWPPMPLSSTTTITFPAWTTTVSYSSLTTSTRTLSDGSTSTYPAYVYVSWLTVLPIPPVTTTAIPVWGVTLDRNATVGPIILTSSVQPPPFTVTVTPALSGTTSIIGATQTTTSSAVPVVWGSRTYSPPIQTQTLGGRTTVIDGHTLPPAIITVTPNPHPTTTRGPGGTVDPVINPKTPKWTSGKTPKPTADPGCPGCGIGCILFCDSLCPFCPPGVFGNLPGGGGGAGGKPNDPNKPNDPSDPDDPDDPDDPEDPDDPDDPDDPEDPDDDATYTVIYNSMNDDVFPTALLAADELSSIYSAALSRAHSAFGDDSQTTATATSKTTTAPQPMPTKNSECMFWDTIFFYTFEIYNIEGWATDGGASLHDEENGCGALTGWDWHAATSDNDAYVYFNLPFFIKAGCVERAIASAGGPKISCKGGGVGPASKRDVDRELDGHPLPVLGSRGNGKTRTTPVFPPYSEEQLREFEDFYRDAQLVASSNHTYVPMDWGTATATLTSAPMTSGRLPQL